MRRTIIALTAVLALTGCGSTPVNPAIEYQHKAPKAIVADAYAALAALTSQHVVGTRTFGSDEASFDLLSDTAGHVTGQVTLHITGTDGRTSDATVDVIGFGGHIYIRGGNDFWHQALPAADVNAALNKWVADVPQLSDDIVTVTLAGRLALAKGYATQTPKVTGISNVAGTPTVQVALVTNGVPIVIDVAAGDPHHILKVDAGPKGAITFDQFNTPVQVTAPAATETIDFARLTS